MAHGDAKSWNPSGLLPAFAIDHSVPDLPVMARSARNTGVRQTTPARPLNSKLPAAHAKAQNENCWKTTLPLAMYVSVVHVWTAPGAQGFCLIWLTERARSCVRPSMRLHDRWPRWVSPNKPQTWMRHVWTAPGAQGFCLIWLTERARSCVRPSMRLHDRWPRWVSPNKPQTWMRHRDALAPSGVSVRRFDRLPSPTVALLLLGDDERSGGLRHAPVSRAVRHHGPQNAGHLVGQSDCRHFARPALQQL